MGNYNGTVTCGHCYQQGHNKRSCPRATERAQSAYQQAKEAGSPDLEYYARALAKRTGINPETGEKRKRRDESYGRKCSYCRERGHSRRTCGSIKDDQRNYRRMAQVVRTDMLGRMREHGFGVGSLLTLAGSEWNEEANKYQDVTSAYLVTKIKWEGIGPHNQGGDSCVKVISVKDPSNQPTLGMPEAVTGSADTRCFRRGSGRQAQHHAQGDRRTHDRIQDPGAAFLSHHGLRDRRTAEYPRAPQPAG